MSYTPEYRAYLAQKHTAAQRGIPFEFDYEDWVNWWEEELGVKWFSKRGRQKGEYVMARIKDQGPYKRGNVKCILATENKSETAENGTSTFGEKHWNNKLSERQVIAIRAASGTLKELAARFCVHSSTVVYIKENRLWSHLDTPIVPYTRKHECKRVLTKEDAITIFQTSGLIKDIAEQYGVNEGTIRAIRDGRSWQHVTDGLKAREGQKDFRVKLTDEQVKIIFYDPRDRHTIAKEYGVAPITVWEIKHKTKRKKVTADL